MEMCLSKNYVRSHKGCAVYSLISSFINIAINRIHTSNDNYVLLQNYTTMTAGLFYPT